MLKNVLKTLLQPKPKTRPQGEHFSLSLMASSSLTMPLPLSPTASGPGTHGPMSVPLGRGGVHNTRSAAPAQAQQVVAGASRLDAAARPLQPDPCVEVAAVRPLRSDLMRRQRRRGGTAAGLGISTVRERPVAPLSEPVMSFRD